MEVTGHRVYNTPYQKVLAVATELANKPNPTLEEDITYFTALYSFSVEWEEPGVYCQSQPSRVGSSHPEQRISVHQCIGSQGGAGRPSRGHRPLLPEDLRNRLSNREGSAESTYRGPECRGVDDFDHFP